VDLPLDGALLVTGRFAASVVAVGAEGRPHPSDHRGRVGEDAVAAVDAESKAAGDVRSLQRALSPRTDPAGVAGTDGERRSSGNAELAVVPFEEEDESPFVGLLQVEAA
jgi:hypothetical protein